ncbi:MAG: helix-turn-helix domain-containing protein, partial [Vicinamibacteria bacterium]
SIRLDRSASRALTRYSWPGNVRELRNAIERAVILAKDGAVQAEDLPAAVVESAQGPLTIEPVDANEQDSTPSRPSDKARCENADYVVGAPGMTLEELKRRLILTTLEATGNNISEASRKLGISARTIYNKIREWNLSPRELAR